MKRDLEQLSAAGVHLGRSIGECNEKMHRYLAGRSPDHSRHIIDLHATQLSLLQARAFLLASVVRGEQVLFVASEEPAASIICQHAVRCGMPFINKPWESGLLSGSQLGGNELSTSRLELPSALVVAESKRYKAALEEARALNIRSIGLVDTDDDPDFVDLPIPCNNRDAESINHIIDLICKMIGEGESVGKLLKPYAELLQAEIAKPETAHGLTWGRKLNIWIEGRDQKHLVAGQPTCFGINFGRLTEFVGTQYESLDLTIALDGNAEIFPNFQHARLPKFKAMSPVHFQITPPATNSLDLKVVIFLRDDATVIEQKSLSLEVCAKGADYKRTC